MGRFLGECLHALDFLLEAAGKIMGAVLKQHDKAKREKDKEDEPEKAAKERHGLMVTYALGQVNESQPHAKLPV